MLGIKLSAVIVLGCSIILAGCSKSNANEKFQDCVLNKATTAAEQATVNLIRKICAKKFQVPLPDEAIKNIDGNTEQSMFDFVIHINNRNTDWTVTQVEFYAVKASLSKKTLYRHDIYIEPLREQNFRPNVPTEPKAGEAFNFGITKAWGLPSNE